MFKRNEKYYALLVPYLEGSLDDVRAADLRARLAEDPALAAEAARLRRTLSSLRETSLRTSALDNAAVPADLWPRLRDRLDPAPISAPRRAAPAGWLAAVGAAVAVAFAAIWLPVGQPREPARVVNSPRPGTAMKGPERVASASKSETLHSAVPALTVSVPHEPAAPMPAVIKPAVIKPVVIKPMTVMPPVSGHDPFTRAKAGGTNAGPKAVAPLVVPVPLMSAGRAAAAPPPVPPKRASPTLMASNGLSRMNGDRVVQTSKMAPPQDTGSASAALDRFDLPSPASAATPSPPAPIGGAKANTPPADNAPAFTKGVPALPPPASATYGARGFAADKTKASVLSGTRGLNAYGILSEHRAKTSGRAGAGSGLQQFVMADPKQTLDAWQASLAQAMQPPLLGQDVGVQQATQALMAASQSGDLDALRERLEARRAQSPRDLGTARMLSAVYDFAFSAEAALHERRRLVTLDGVMGEDWFALAEAEGHTGNAQAARAAYRRALEAPGPLSGFHAQIAKARG